MDIKIFFSTISLLVGFAGTFPYIRDILKHKTRPHSYSWLIWSVTLSIGAFGAVYGGGGLGALNLVIGTIINFVIFFLSLKYGTKNITVKDRVALAVALGAILIWRFLQNPLLAVVVASAVDAVGYFPSFRKTFQEPWSENVTTWLSYAIGNIFLIFALTKFNALTLIYVITITICNFAMVAICLYRRKTVPKPILP